MSTGRFGFTKKPAGDSDFLPIVKYDARAGRMFRIDRVDTGSGFESTAVDITAIFKAIFDFENLETGWINFVAGQQPDFALVKMPADGSPFAFPPQPSPNHKTGVRFMLRLSNQSGGDKPVREIAGTSGAFVGAVEQAFDTYMKGKDANPGMLPVFWMDTHPVKTGSGTRSSTNYHPTFHLDGWAPRGDLVPQPKAHSVTVPPQNAYGTGSGNGSAKPAQAESDFGATPPDTGGAIAVPPPQQQTKPPANDFG